MKTLEGLKNMGWSKKAVVLEEENEKQVCMHCTKSGLMTLCETGKVLLRRENRGV